MAPPPDSPDSPLSSLASDDFGDDSRVLDAVPDSAPRPSASKRTTASSSMQGSGGASAAAAAKAPSISKPPAKRRRTGTQNQTQNRESTTARGGNTSSSSSRAHGGAAATAAAGAPQKKSSADDNVPGSPSAQSISSDSSGDVPASPTLQALIGGTAEDDYSGLMPDQVTVCQWEGCNGRDFGDMDALVKHIHDEHIGTRQRKYLCEWNFCQRKGQTHASGYALRAHMRSHTKEKPFYCSLPECDRSFTRSDALSKHMRTVHEPEALRVLEHGPSAPGVTASATLASNKASKTPRIKLKFSQAPPTEDDKNKAQSSQHHEHDDDTSDNHNATTTATQENPLTDPSTPAPELGPDLGFNEDELALPVDKLHNLLRRQVHWAEQERDELDRTSEIIQRLRKGAWLEKELILEDVMRLESELLKGRKTTYTFGGGDDAADDTRLSADVEPEAPNDDEDDGSDGDDDGEGDGEGDDTRERAIEAAPS